MTALIIIVFILQLALFIWAVGITITMMDLYKILEQTLATSNEAFTALFDSEKTSLHAMNAVLKTVTAVEDEARGFKAQVDQELENQKLNNRFALDTIQEARRIYNKVNQTTQEEEVDG